MCYLKGEGDWEVKQVSYCLLVKSEMLSIPDDDKHGFMTEILCMRMKQKKYIVFLPF